jgi:ribosomal-protein-alanine N-acetyltransferase
MHPLPDPLPAAAGAPLQVRLIPASDADLTAGSARLDRSLDRGFDSRQEATETCLAVLQQFEQPTRPAAWGPFWTLGPATQTIAGIAGYKAKPAEGSVEIAYLTFPRLEGRGYATAAVRGLIELAAGEVDRIVAHTLPEENASNAALTKCGFEFDGIADDPDDGPVWRWSKSLQSPAS